MRIAMLVLMAAAPAAATAQTYYVDIYNTAPDSVIAFAEAPAGSGAFREVALSARAVQGGGDSATVAFHKADGGCLRDLRLVFADGRVLEQRGFNVCKYRSYHTGRYLPVATRPSRIVQR